MTVPANSIRLMNQPHKCGCYRAPFDEACTLLARRSKARKGAGGAFFPACGPKLELLVPGLDSARKLCAAPDEELADKSGELEKLCKTAVEKQTC